MLSVGELVVYVDVQMDVAATEGSAVRLMTHTLSTTKCVTDKTATHTVLDTTVVRLPTNWKIELPCPHKVYYLQQRHQQQRLVVLKKT